MIFELRTLMPSDAPAAAALHAQGFDDPWSEAAFAVQFSAGGAAAAGGFESEALIVFAVFQMVAGEADLLTVATSPARRSKGLARRLLTAMIGDLRTQGISRVTLDVAEDNAPARHLYTALGFAEDGRRPRYYTAGRTSPADAILMSMCLTG